MCKKRSCENEFYLHGNRKLLSCSEESHYPPYLFYPPPPPPLGTTVIPRVIHRFGAKTWPSNKLEPHISSTTTTKINRAPVKEKTASSLLNGVASLLRFDEKNTVTEKKCIRVFHIAHHTLFTPSSTAPHPPKKILKHCFRFLLGRM